MTQQQIAAILQVRWFANYHARMIMRLQQGSQEPAPVPTLRSV